ncbi:hypothetical protein SteCoe_16322 [Stentor coeruleus]|uniref:Acyl carrier protein n=1 Tax=Stentor coeruleus TaxID=5963 RepID=A0A1R2C1E6_9CILI|nr:hypothetical protein SteCoe_16322 [Stentor coeruleus]
MWRAGNFLLRSQNIYRFPIRWFSGNQATVESSILEQLRGVEGVNLSKLTSKCTFKEIGLDSLAQIEMYSSLEDKFKITLSDEDTDGVKSVPDLVKIILSKL